MPRTSGKNFARYYISIIIISLMFIPGLLRLYDLQIRKSVELQRLARRQHELMIDIRPSRGHIYDRKMKILATSLKVPSIYAVPRMVTEKEKTAEKLSAILGIDKETLLEKLNRDKSFVWLKRRVTDDVKLRIEGLHDPNISMVYESKRFYPHDAICSNIIGYCDIDEKGIEGLELYYNDILKGEKGYKVTKRDAMGREIAALQEKMVPAVNGHNMVLTIDHFIQYTAEQALYKAYSEQNAKGASCVVMDPYTGQILAMASLPNFNVNKPEEATPDSRRNRAIVDYYEPGSVFKIVTASAALNEGAFNEEDEIFCENGQYHLLRSRVLHDTHSYGTLTFSQVIEKSSNIGTVKIGQRLGDEKEHSYMRAFGFGQVTGIDLPGEIGGVVLPLPQWTSYSITSVPIGQEVTVTSLQMAQAMSVIANGGKLMKPYIVSQIFDEKGIPIKKVEPQVERQVITPETALRMRRILQKVVTQGTGKLAAVEGVTTGGKTGTAQKILPTGGYSHSNFMASFCGFAPVENPQVVINVVVDDPHPVYYGGSVSAPVFADIVKEVIYYLNQTNSRKVAA